MLFRRDRLFCDINPTCYKISVQKEIIKRHIHNFLSKEKIARSVQKEPLPVVISSHSSNMIKRAPGVDLTLQLNKAVNIDIASKTIYGRLIKPGETFSFWDCVGKITKAKGYMDGRVIRKNKLVAGIGGGLCNLSNTLHLLVLHSPMDVTEFHQHSDALAPDEGVRIPFSAGTSVNYNNIDYRFKNNTDQTVQILVWCDGEMLHAQLRSEREYPWQYELVEEDHHFAKKNDIFYRNSKIYRNVTEKSTGKLLRKELILDNHSQVMYDYDLIPKDLIRV